jgi:hypothetical protein
VFVYGNHSCGCEYKFFQFPTGEIHTNAQLEFVYLCTGNEAVTGEKKLLMFFTWKFKIYILSSTYGRTRYIVRVV